MKEQMSQNNRTNTTDRDLVIREHGRDKAEGKDEDARFVPNVEEIDHIEKAFGFLNQYRTAEDVEAFISRNKVDGLSESNE